MRITKDAIYFWGGSFSQWFKSPFEVDGVEYVTAEQYMMAMKAKTFEGNEDILEKIMSTGNAKKQKALGRQVRNFDTDEWNEVSMGHVVTANIAKFSQSESLLAELIESGDRELVEASPHDTIWGIGLHWNDDAVLDKEKWRGENKLGKAIMTARETILQQIEV